LPKGVEITGADLAADPTFPGLYTDQQDGELPLALNWTIDWAEPKLCRIRNSDRSRQWMAGAQAMGQILRIEWPAGVPFAGLLRLDGEWAEGLKIGITVEPGQFPYVAWNRRTEPNPHLIRLLTGRGLLTPYCATIDPAEKMAMALAVVVAEGLP
jgi:hypothetical protein